MFPPRKEGEQGGVGLFAELLKRLMPPSPTAPTGKGPHVPTKPKNPFFKGGNNCPRFALRPSFRFLLALGWLVLPLAACNRNAAPALPEVDYQKAKDMSDAVAEDLVKENEKDLSNRLDLGFHTVINGPQDLRKVMENMYAMYGRPTSYVFKIAKMGVRVDGDWKRNSRTFFYAVKTTQFPMGKYYLKIEVVNAFSGGFLDVSGFGFFTFKDGNTPDILK